MKKITFDWSEVPLSIFSIGLIIMPISLAATFFMDRPDAWIVGIFALIFTTLWAGAMGLKLNGSNYRSWYA